MTTIAEPTEAELKQVLAVAGSLSREQTGEEEQMVQAAVEEYRAERRSRKR
jgi:hypothetical protein